DHHHQLRPSDRLGVCAACRGDEGALFEPLVIHHEAAVLPVQELEQVPVPVAEDIHAPGGGVRSHGVPHQAAQPVKALSHIQRRTVEVIAVGGAQAEHQYRRISLDNRDRSIEQVFSFTPLGKTSSTALSLPVKELSGSNWIKPEGSSISFLSFLNQ